MKIYRVLDYYTDWGYDFFFRDKEKARQFALERMDTMYSQAIKDDLVKWHNVSSWEEAKPIVLEECENGIAIEEIEVIE